MVTPVVVKVAAVVRIAFRVVLRRVRFPTEFAAVSVALDFSKMRPSRPMMPRV